MFKWLFGEKCEHDFQIIKTKYSEYVNDYGMLKYSKNYIIFCPKCGKEKKVDAERYDMEQEKKRIRDKYNR
jgi:hypothetical protein